MSESIIEERKLGIDVAGGVESVPISGSDRFLKLLGINGGKFSEGKLGFRVRRDFEKREDCGDKVMSIDEGGIGFTEVFDVIVFICDAKVYVCASLSCDIGDAMGNQFEVIIRHEVVNDF